MNTRFTQLVKYKKNEMQKSERELLRANNELLEATESLESSYTLLNALPTPQKGNIEIFLQSRLSLCIQRDIIQQDSQQVELKNSSVKNAKEELKESMIEHEKFQYLEAEQIKKIIKKRNMQEAKSLDEAALQTFIGKTK